MIHYQGYLWEITSRIVAHFGIFYFLKRREGNRIIIQEVEEGLLTAQIMIQSTEEVNNGKKQ
jgi:hypothetical protein